MRGGKDLSLPLDSRANPSPSDLLVARNRPRILLMNPTPRRGKCRAFTLPEIFIALGIFGALLFLVHHAEREAEEETRATLIASGVMDSLGLTDEKSRVTVACGMSNGLPVWETLRSATATNRTIAYDASCLPLRPLPDGKAEDPDAAALVTVTLSPKISDPGITVVDVAVAFPAAAPAARRSVHRFVRLLAVP